MTKPKEKKKEKISVATEIDRIEERRSLCQDSLDKAEYRRRRGQLSEKDRKVLDEEVTIITERIQKYERELEVLRSENRRNMMLSVALLVLLALFYYAFIA
ncbi:coiled-coil domain-containing protein 167 [Scleropages formosus]|uniref:Coiled-coil domain-containing protein 167 n=1 Tax=Scleropages formosus TaxID=113540 RepID=A0A8C9WF38_SCLFO|nr:coiled-coil domain-containing protein 167 [Scleropages formosus]